MATGTEVQVVMPQMGVSVSEGTITKWLKQVGEPIARDEPLLEISTDKVDTEVPSPGEGVVSQILVAEGQTVDVGTVLATIAPAGSAVAEPAAEAPPPAAPEPAPAAAAPATPAEPVAAPRAACTTGRTGTRRSRAGGRRQREELRLPGRRTDRGRARSRPLVAHGHRHRRPRDEEGHPRLHRVGRGPAAGCTGARAGPASACAHRGARTTAGRTTGAATRGRRATAGSGCSAGSRTSCPRRSASGSCRCTSSGSRPGSCSFGGAPAPAPGEVVEPMNAMRRGIAEHMRRSLDTSAHVTSAIEVDMSRVVALRKKLKPEYESTHGVNVTYLAFIARAVVETLKDYPWINGEIRGESIVTRPYVNLGFAVELTDGKGLIVPVLKNAETLNLLGIAKGVADIAERARSKKLLPDEVQGGTFTITNPGGYGTFHGTPVISQPQAGILGTYAVVKRPWVVQDEMGQDVIAVRPIMNLTLTYDHRLVDGALAGRFLRDLRQRLETWDEAAY